MSHPGLTEEELQLLDPVLRIVATAGGLDAALRFAEKHGGLRVWVPAEATPDHQLVACIGLPALKALVDAYPKEFVAPSKATRLLRTIRNRVIHAARPNSSLRDLAVAHKLTRRRVEQIMAEGCGQLPADQADLFG